MPRIEKTECSLDETRGKNKTDLPTNSKWQIGLVLWQKVARRETERSAASAKRAVRDGYSFQFNRACAPSLEPDCVRFPKFCWNPGGIPKGAALGAPLGKSPGVEGRSALLIGGTALLAFSQQLQGASPCEIITPTPLGNGEETTFPRW